MSRAATAAAAAGQVGGTEGTESRDLLKAQQVFGYTQEDLSRILLPMARTGKEPVGAMGMDCPLPILSEQPQMLYDYFQQNFAQVTNPPIDALRENVVTSTSVMIGNVANIMDPDEAGTYALAVDRPLLTNKEMAVIKGLRAGKLRAVCLSLLYAAGGGDDALKEALDTVTDFAATGKLPRCTPAEARQRYLNAAVAGIQTVLSKMGISTVRSYHGAQIFEAVGINKEVVGKYFPHTPSRIEGLGLQEIARENELRHRRAFPVPSRLADGNIYQYKKEGPDPHILDPETIAALQQAVRTGDGEAYRRFADRVDHQALFRLRDLLDFDSPDGCSIPVEEVEPVESIVRRFRTGAMSYGALSKEAHECLAIAMNRLGGRSNTGEGGENPARFAPGPDGLDRNDAIKQVSTARFGVTGNYLVHAQELQIKCAQGAKPGQGGNLPGARVFPEIARTRHSTPGVALISPPPHHDIYSIEDLAELSSLPGAAHGNRNLTL